MMNRLSFLSVTILLAGCLGEASLEDQSQNGPLDSRYAPCTDALKCCSPTEMKCVGDADTSMRCTCSNLWDCSKNPKKCEQDKQVPPEKPGTPPGSGGGWDCTFTATEYVCQGHPTSPPGPSPGGGWSCTAAPGGTVVCKRTPPNPSNKPDGGAAWKCSVNNELGKIECEQTGTPGTPGTPGNPSNPNNPNNPGTPGTPSNPGTPGTPSNPGTPGTPGTPSNPGTPGTPSNPGNPGNPSNPGTPWPPWPQGNECQLGQKKWCDGEQYCGWGQVVCGPDGTWKKKGFLGLGGLDCQELANGARPNTTCACYFTFFNAKCCETPDCLVPAGTNGQICPATAGGLCDYCNPANATCSAPGGKCVITSEGETFCGQGCGSQPCPTGYKCMAIQGKGNQCIPNDMSCFF